MGKLKRRSRSSQHRNNPLRARGSGSSEQIGPETAAGGSKVAPLIAKLQAKGLTGNERSIVLSTISVMCEEPKLRSLFLKEKLIPVLLENYIKEEGASQLGGIDEEITVESYGLLRNLIIEEGYDVCMYLWRQGIFGVLLSSLSRIETINMEEKTPAEQSLVFDYIENIISIINLVGDSSDKIFGEIMGSIEPILRIVFKLIKNGVDTQNSKLLISQSLYNILLNLIYDFSTESAEFVKLVEAESKQIEFKSLLNSNFLTKVLILGINLQFYEVNGSTGEHSSQDDAVFYRNMVTELLKGMREFDLAGKTAELQKLKTFDGGQAAASTIKNQLKQFQHVKSEFEAIEISVELISVIFEIMGVNEIMLTDDHNESGSHYNVSELCFVLVDTLCKLSEHGEFQSKCYAALNNMSWYLMQFHHSDLSSRLLEFGLKELKFKNRALAIDMRTNLAGVVWSSLMMLEHMVLDQGTVQGLIMHFEEQLQSEHKNQDEYREYFVRMVGVLGVIATQSVESNLKVSQLFVSVLKELKETETPLSVLQVTLLTEIVAEMFKIYNDKAFEYDEPVFRQGQYLNVLEGLASRFKSEAKLVDKHAQPELRQRALQVHQDLLRFIDYKQNE